MSLIVAPCAIAVGSQASEQPQAEAMDMQYDSFLRRVPGVVHVGANSGQERDVYRDLGLRVLWIEAINEVFDELVRNIAGHPKQKSLCALLTDRDGAEYQFHIASNSGASSSIYQFGECLDIWPELSYLSSRTLRSSRLDSLFRLEGIQPSDYPALVMDVQGAELLVLKGAGQMLGEFRFVKAEAADFESYIDCAKLEDLRQYLEPWGFKEIGRHPFASHPNGGTYWDVVWERPAKSILEQVRWWIASVAKTRQLSN